MRRYSFFILLMIVIEVYGQSPQLVVPLSSDQVATTKYSPNRKSILTSSIDYVSYDEAKPYSVLLYNALIKMPLSKLCFEQK